VPAALLIRDVTVVDTLSGALSPALDVLVRETRITSITPGGTAVPRDTDVVEVDVANLRRIDAVILGGLHLDAARLQRVRAEVEAIGLR
jgi:hypothetical protein